MADLHKEMLQAAEADNQLLVGPDDEALGPIHPMDHSGDDTLPRTPKAAVDSMDCLNSRLVESEDAGVAVADGGSKTVNDSENTVGNPIDHLMNHVGGRQFPPELATLPRPPNIGTKLYFE